MLRRQISRASAVGSPLKVVFLLVKYNLGKFHFAAYQNKLPRLRVQHVIFINITPSLPTRVCVCCLQYSSLSLRVYVECFFLVTQRFFLDQTSVFVGPRVLYIRCTTCMYVYKGIMSSLTVRNVQINAMECSVQALRNIHMCVCRSPLYE